MAEAEPSFCESRERCQSVRDGDDLGALRSSDREAKNGTDWVRNLEGMKAFLDKAEDIGLPKEWLLTVLGVKTEMMIEDEQQQKQKPAP